MAQPPKTLTRNLIRPQIHDQLRALLQHRKRQILQPPLGHFEPDRRQKNDHRVLLRQLLGQIKQPLYILHHRSGHLLHHLVNPLDIIELPPARLERNAGLLGDLVEVLSVARRQLLAEQLSDDGVVELVILLDEQLAGLRLDLEGELLLELVGVAEELLEEGVGAVVVEDVARDQL